VLRVEAPAVAQGVVDQRQRGRGAGRAEHQVREQLDWDVLEIRRDQPRRAAAALGGGQERVGVRRRCLQHLEHRGLEAERLLVRLVVRRPAAGRGERHDGLRAAARRELERHVAAQRVPDHVRGLQARLVHRALDRVRQRGVADLLLDRWPAGMARQRRREDVVIGGRRAAVRSLRGDMA
jgi:hypothetical protein